MRIQNPAKYAEVLLNIARPREQWTAQKIKSMFGGGEQNLQLQPTQIWLHLTYQTAFVDDAGQAANSPRRLQSRRPDACGNQERTRHRRACAGAQARAGDGIWIRRAQARSPRAHRRCPSNRCLMIRRATPGRSRRDRSTARSSDVDPCEKSYRVRRFWGCPPRFFHADLVDVLWRGGIASVYYSIPAAPAWWTILPHLSISLSTKRAS